MKQTKSTIPANPSAHSKAKKRVKVPPTTVLIVIPNVTFGISGFKCVRAKPHESDPNQVYVTLVDKHGFLRVTLRKGQYFKTFKDARKAIKSRNAESARIFTEITDIS